MGWIVFAVLQITVIAAGLRKPRRAGVSIWSKFLFAVSFSGLEILAGAAPLYYIDIRDPRFLRAFLAAWTIVAINFGWMFAVARRWRLAEGRAHLEGYRDPHP